MDTDIIKIKSIKYLIFPLFLVTQFGKINAQSLLIKNGDNIKGVLLESKPPLNTSYKIVDTILREKHRFDFIKIYSLGENKFDYNWLYIINDLNFLKHTNSNAKQIFNKKKLILRDSIVFDQHQTFACVNDNTNNESYSYLVYKNGILIDSFFSNVAIEKITDDIILKKINIFKKLNDELRLLSIDNRY